MTTPAAPAAPYQFDEKDPAQAALKLQEEKGWALNLEPKSLCVEHGPQNGPGCPACFHKYGTKGRPLTDEEKAGRPPSVDDLRAELAQLRQQLADQQAQNQQAAQEFANWKTQQSQGQAAPQNPQQV